MKYLKMLSLAAVAAAALMAFVGASTASATELYGSGGTLGAGTTVHAELQAGTNWVMEAGFGNKVCDQATIQGQNSTAGSSSTTVAVPLDVLTFGNCTGNTVTVLKRGLLEIHHIAGTTDGTVTSSGTEITFVNHAAGGVHCIYKTENTDFGRLTGSEAGNAALHLDAAMVRVPTSFLCASEATWKATIAFTLPAPLWVEAS